MAHISHFAGIPIWKVKRRQRRTVIKRTFHIGNACGIPFWNVKRFQGRTIVEYIVHLRDFIGIPIRNVKRCKTAATIEGVADICNGGSIPRGNVKRSKTDAIIERSVEYFYFCGVPAGKVKRRQRRTITKQELHILDIPGIPRGDVFYLRQLGATAKHTAHIRDHSGFKVGKIDGRQFRKLIKRVKAIRIGVNFPVWKNIRFRPINVQFYFTLFLHVDVYRLDSCDFILVILRQSEYDFRHGSTQSISELQTRYKRVYAR